LQSLWTFTNDHVPKPRQVIGKNIQLAAFTTIFTPALVTIAPDSKVTCPAVGRIFKTADPISPIPLMIEVAFLPLLLIFSSISDSISFSSFFVLFFLISKSLGLYLNVCFSCKSLISSSLIP
jgi:hypothetical protein